MSRQLAAAIGVAGALLAAGPALAQKSADTIRIAITDMFPISDPYNFPLDENAAFYGTVYQPLVDYDERNGKFVGNLATAWKRVDDLTLEFDLKQNVKFHNGDTFTAEDVKVTWDWAGDEKTRIRFKERYNWVKEVEILGPHKIRVHNKFKNVGDLANVAYNLKILNGKALNSVENKNEYGRLAPIGTGPYKINYLEKNKGILTERFTDYHGTATYRAPVKFVHGIPMPDRQTQVAQLLTGGVDLLRFISTEDARQLAQQPNLAVTVTPSASLIYVTLDAVGRSSNKAFTDERVRKAFIMAVPREQLIKELIAGGETAERPKSICFKATIACAPTSEPYKYDPAQAKKLLAEAGYKDGFDLLIYAHAPHKHVAEAIAGEVRKVGIRASVEPLPLALYVKKRGDGEFTAFVGLYPTSANPDVDNLIDFFFGQDRDYWKDDVIHNIKKQAEGEFDLAKRTQMYVPALNRINEKAYIYPLTEQPMPFAHTKDVKLLPTTLRAGDPRLGDYAWSDYKDK